MLAADAFGDENVAIIGIWSHKSVCAKELNLLSGIQMNFAGVRFGCHEVSRVAVEVERLWCGQISVYIDLTTLFNIGMSVINKRRYL